MGSWSPLLARGELGWAGEQSALMDQGPAGAEKLAQGTPANYDGDALLPSGTTWLKTALTLRCLPRSQSRKFCLKYYNSALSL